MADFKKLKDGQGNSYNVKDATARTNLASHTSNTSNPHSVTKSQVGLGNVDNTSDLNKPVSTAQRAALDLKIDKSSIKTSTPETPTDNDVPSIKYLEDTFAKITEFYETLGCGYALVSDNLTPYSSSSGSEQHEPFILEGTGTGNGTSIVDTGSYAQIKEKRGNTVVVNQWVSDEGKTFTNGNTTDSKTALNLQCVVYEGGTVVRTLIGENIATTGLKIYLMVYPRWSALSGDMIAAREELENEFQGAQPAVEADVADLTPEERVAFLEGKTFAWTEQMMARWKTLAHHLIVQYNDQPGSWDQPFYDAIVRDTGTRYLVPGQGE